MPLRKPRKRRASKKTPKVVAKGTKWMLCKVDGCMREIEVAADTKAVTCAAHTLALVAGMEGKPTPKKSGEGWPRGWWKRLEFVGPDGITYHKGKA